MNLNELIEEAEHLSESQVRHTIPANQHRSRTLLPLLLSVVKNQQRQIELAEETLKRLRGQCDDGAARSALYNMGQLAAELEDIK